MNNLPLIASIAQSQREIFDDEYLAKDKKNQLVFLADSAFSLQMTQQKYPTIKFHLTSEF